MVFIDRPSDFNSDWNRAKNGAVKSSGAKTYTATLVGHSSADGSNGGIVADTSSLTSALNIVKSITINVQ